jgi:HEAT repeat protein
MKFFKFNIRTGIACFTAVFATMVTVFFFRFQSNAGRHYSGKASGTEEPHFITSGSPEDFREAVPFLMEMLENTDEKVQIKAAVSLLMLKDKRAIPVFIQSLKDENFVLRKISQRAVMEFGDEFLLECLEDFLSHCSGETLLNLSGRLCGIEEQAIPRICDVLRAENWKARFNACMLLGNMGDASALNCLVPLVEDTDRRIREGAVWALGNIGDKTAFPALLKALKDPYYPIRWTAAEALGNLSDERVAPALNVALNDPNWVVRRHAEASLGRGTITNTIQDCGMQSFHLGHLYELSGIRDNPK